MEPPRLGITAFDKDNSSIARSDEAMRRLTAVPGIVPSNATALVAVIGNDSAFTKGRHYLPD